MSDQIDPPHRPLNRYKCLNKKKEKKKKIKKQRKIGSGSYMCTIFESSIINLYVLCGMDSFITIKKNINKHKFIYNTVVCLHV